MRRCGTTIVLSFAERCLLSMEYVDMPDTNLAMYRNPGMTQRLVRYAESGSNGKVVPTAAISRHTVVIAIVNAE